MFHGESFFSFGSLACCSVFVQVPGRFSPLFSKGALPGMHSPW